jgi:hypothetical protein
MQSNPITVKHLLSKRQFSNKSRFLVPRWPGASLRARFRDRSALASVGSLGSHRKFPTGWRREWKSGGLRG